MLSIESVSFVCHVLKHFHAKSDFWEERKMHNNCGNDSCKIEVCITNKHWFIKLWTHKHKNDDSTLDTKSHKDEHHKLGQNNFVFAVNELVEGKTVYVMLEF